VWRDPAAGRYTTRTQLNTERDLVVTARQSRGGALTPADLRDAEAELRERGLSEDQINAVLGVLGSNRVADALVSAAGTGKSFTVGQLADQWERRTGGRVLGLATSQIAAEVLMADGLEALNTTRFLQAYEANPRTGGPWERLGHRDLLVVDESNMSSTQELARIQRIAAAAGAKMLYTGDPRQLKAVGAGGALGLIARENGCFELQTVHRFKNDWEKQASLRLREGDLDVLELYEQHGRINAGTAEEMRRRAVLNYVHDTALRGRSSVLVTATNDEAAQVSAEVQQRLAGMGQLGWIEVERLADGNRAYRHDLVQARKNNRQVRTSGALTMVTNRERYRVVGWWGDELEVEREDGAGRAWLPREYVENHLVLGYAGTEHACEGLSVDTGHALTAGYVALTRGREENHAYVTTQEDGDHHGPGLNATPREILRQRFAETAQELTAVEARREEAAKAENLATLVGIWDYTGREIDDYRHGDMILHALGSDLADRIQMENGAPGLYQVLREAEAYGHDAEQLLTRAIHERPLYRVDDLAAVLRHRIERHLQPETASFSWSDRTPAISGPLGQFRRELAGMMDAREREIGRQAAEQQPEWALEALGPVPDASYQEQRQEWERRAAHIGAWREIAGLRQPGIGARPEGWLDRLLWQRAARATGMDPELLDYRTASESTLRAWISRAARAMGWAPEYVAEDLGTARRLVRRHQSEAALAQARAEAASTEVEREQALAAMERSQRLAERMSARVEQLEELHEARTEWLQATAEIRHRAEMARAELARRGLDCDRQAEQDGEQAELFDVAEVLRPGLAAEHVEQVRQLANQRAAEESAARLQEYLHGPEEATRRASEEAARDASRQAEFAERTEAEQAAEVEQETAVDQHQLSLWTEQELQADNEHALAAAETVHAREEELEASPQRPLAGVESVREAARRAEYARQMLQRYWQRTATEEAELEFEQQYQQLQQQADAERAAEVEQETAVEEPQLQLEW